MINLDCVMVVDGDLSPPAERQLLRLIKAHREGSIRTGLLTLRCPRTAIGWLASPEIMALIDGETVHWIDQDVGARAPLALVLSPGLAVIDPITPLRLRCERVVVWPLEPELDLPKGDVAEDAEAFEPLLSDHAPWMAREIAARLSAPVAWAARTAGERHDLAQHAIGLTLTDWVWWPILDDGASDSRPSATARHYVGRHWLGEIPLDPAGYGEFAAAFSDCWPMDLAFHGERPLLESLPEPDQSQGMTLFEAEQTPLSDFMAGLSLFVAVGDRQATTRMPYALFEAMQEDVVVIAPPAMSAIIDSALPEAEPNELMGLAASLLGDDLAYERAKRRQRQLLADRHGAKAHLARLRPYLDGQAPSLLAGLSTNTALNRVLFVSDDSPHLEHLTRTLAIADRLPDPLTPHFVTTARNARLVEERGYAVDYVQAHNSAAYHRLFEDASSWNYWFERHLAELIAFTKARALVFDGVYPFGGVMTNRKRFPSLSYIWVRQPLWRPDAKGDALKHGRDFDLVIEPGDLATAFDRGPLTGLRNRVLATAPIRLDRPMDRNDARQALGLSDETSPAILVDPTLPPERIEGETLTMLLSSLVEDGAKLWCIDPAHASFASTWSLPVQRLDDPAAGRYRAAFDAAIAAADYRSLHENVEAGLPSVLVAGLGSSTDDQAARVAFAEGRGFALPLRSGDVYGARAAARQLMDPGSRERMRAALSGLVMDDGAKEAACTIGDLVFSVSLPKSLGNA